MELKLIDQIEPDLNAVVEKAANDLKNNRWFVSEDATRKWMRSLGTSHELPKPAADIYLPEKAQ